MNESDARIAGFVRGSIPRSIRQPDNAGLVSRALARSRCRLRWWGETQHASDTLAAENLNHITKICAEVTLRLLPRSNLAARVQ